MNDDLFNEVKDILARRLAHEQRVLDLTHQIKTWERNTRAELAEHERQEQLEKLPNFGRF